MLIKRRIKNEGQYTLLQKRTSEHDHPRDLRETSSSQEQKRKRVSEVVSNDVHLRTILSPHFVWKAAGLPTHFPNPAWKKVAIFSVT